MGPLLGVSNGEGHSSNLCQQSACFRRQRKSRSQGHVIVVKAVLKDTGACLVAGNAASDFGAGMFFQKRKAFLPECESMSDPQHRPHVIARKIFVCGFGLLFGFGQYANGRFGTNGCWRLVYRWCRGQQNGRCLLVLSLYCVQVHV